MGQRKLRFVLLFFGILAPLYLFGSLAEDVVEHDVFWFDRPVLMFLHAHATPYLDAGMVLLSWAGSAYSLVPLNALIFAYLVLKRRRGTAAFWLLAVAGAALLNFIAKHAFLRTRPTLWSSISPEITYSFPSGHSMNTMAVVVALTVLLWNTGWRQVTLATGACFVLLVGLSRMYLGVHYPSDILAGWAASCFWVLGLTIVSKKFRALPAPP
jgi:membrane-associated phospholipid phosphatase